MVSARRADSSGFSEAIREGLPDNCRVGETHRLFRGIGGLHPPTPSKVAYVINHNKRSPGADNMGKLGYPDKRYP